MYVVSSVPDSEPAEEVGASLAPVTVTVTVIEAVVPPPSETTAVRVSVGVSSGSSAWVSESASSMVHVHAPSFLTYFHLDTLYNKSNLYSVL